MPLEIERKFLVLKMDPKMEKWLREPYPSLHSIYIQQGYFGGNSVKHLRIRIEDLAHASVTSKEGMGISREEEICNFSDLNLADFLLKHCAYTLRKTRWHYYPKCELDIYHGLLTGLVIAEFELSSPDEQIIMPSFIWDAKEITDSITNFHLARMASELENEKREEGFSIIERVLRKTAKVPVIVLTGGPCSGKSTMMAKLKQNPALHCVPETSTILISLVGIDPNVDPIRFQKAVYGVQKIFELTSLEQAIDQQKKALVTDRGTMDNAAYFEGGISHMTRVFGTTIEHEYSRYDLVILLEVPSREIYVSENKNNPARTETYEQALELQDKTIEAWSRHPNFYCVKNESGWKQKEKKIAKIIERYIKSRA